MVACRLSIALAALSVATLAAAQRPLPWRGPDMPKMTGLIQNQDCTDFFGQHDVAGGDGGAMLDAYIDTLAEAGVTVMMVNTNARKTNYKSDVWESFWDGYDPEGADDQPIFASIPADRRDGYRKLIHSMWALDDQGVDYPARAAEHCRARGISPWITLRMNDVHDNDNLAHPFHGELWRDAKYHRGGPPTYESRGLDYAHPEVRETYRTLVSETLSRYDIDGLELDFMREPYLFKPGAEEEGAKILREWLRGVRRLVHDASVRRGHPIYLGVRVPSRIDVAQSWGLDAVGWAKDGLVDLVVPTPRWSTLEYDMPLAEWREALDGTGVTLAGGLEVLHRPLPNGPPVHVSTAQAAGAAASVLAGGADVVYLFNYFARDGSHPAWSREDYIRTLDAMSSLVALNALPRRHAITWRDITGRDEAYAPPFPAEGETLEFALPTSPPPPEGASASVEITLAQPPSAEAPAELSVNDQPCEFDGQTAKGDAETVLRYTVSVSALGADPHDRITIRATGGSIRVVGVEIAITP